MQTFDAKVRGQESNSSDYMVRKFNRLR